ncbi:single-stranded DNA-binding protein [Parapedobacter sp. 10938]|uniref:single-stranded DNA-binding protein n=1 Tax=Parapedobacter flavus TaxID=3110225 RepID=UPI002DB5EDD8|nr:single-stranded DNA-binding protein [Parapedobacter sp. 10938]MEC3881818.1 single-stranded DNA-binding protein [Parapedobacter sp. 10938]
MNTHNESLLIGFVGSDATLSQSAAGDKYCRFSVATSNFRKSKNDNKTLKTTTWHDIVCFGRMAEFAADFAKKGALVLVKGPIEKNEWEDGAGNKNTSYSVVAKTFKRMKGPSEKTVAGIVDAKDENEVEFVEPDEAELDENEIL